MRQEPQPAITHVVEPASPTAAWPTWLRLLAAGPGALVVLVALVAALRSEPFPDDGVASTASSSKARADEDDDEPPRRSGKGDDAGERDAPPKPGATLEPIQIGPTAEVRAAQGALADRLLKNDLKGAVVALRKLLEVQPDAAKDAGLRDKIVDLAMRVMLVQGPEPDQVFQMIGGEMGTDGIDILYQLATTKGGSKAAKYAETLLDDERLLESRGSKAVQVAWRLRRANCEQKRALFETAGEDGDRRTLGQLFELNRDCRRRTTCCLHKDKGLEAAIAELKKRGFN